MRPLFEEELLSQDNMQLNIKGIVRLMISERILLPGMVFMIDILKLICIKYMFFKFSNHGK